MLDDDHAGKPEGIHLEIGQRPRAAFGNSVGDQQMLEYTSAGDGARLAMLVLHDDAKREYAYGPAQGLPDSKVGTFTQALYDEAKKQGWTVISMKNDWKRIFGGTVARSMRGECAPQLLRIGIIRVALDQALGIAARARGIAAVAPEGECRIQKIAIVGLMRERAVELGERRRGFAGAVQGSPRTRRRSARRRARVSRHAEVRRAHRRCVPAAPASSRGRSAARRLQAPAAGRRAAPARRAHRVAARATDRRDSHMPARTCGSRTSAARSCASASSMRPCRA